MTSMKILPLLAVAATLTSGCAADVLTPGPGAASAQESPRAGADAGAHMDAPGRGLRGGLRGDPLARLLVHREELALTEEQVARLEALAIDLRSRQEALRTRLQAQSGEHPARSRGDRSRLSEEERTALREEMQARRAALQPLMQEMRESQRGALAQVLEILTDEQEATLRELRTERAGARGGEPADRDGRRRGLRRPAP